MAFANDAERLMFNAGVGRRGGGLAPHMPPFLVGGGLGMITPPGLGGGGLGMPQQGPGLGMGIPMPMAGGIGGPFGRKSRAYGLGIGRLGGLAGGPAGGPAGGLGGGLPGLGGIGPFGMSPLAMGGGYGMGVGGPMNPLLMSYGRGMPLDFLVEQLGMEDWDDEDEVDKPEDAWLIEMMRNKRRMNRRRYCGYGW